MGFRLALVQPIAHRPPDDERNVRDALQQVSYAASQGAEVVAFPETYPGPWRTPMTFDPTGDGCRGERARCHGPVRNSGSNHG